MGKVKKNQELKILEVLMKVEEMEVDEIEVEVQIEVD